MTDEGFRSKVLARLRERGWETSPSNLDEGVTVVKGTRRNANHDRLLALIETDSEPITANHVEFIVKKASEHDVESVVVASQGELSGQASELCDEHNIERLKMSPASTSADKSGGVASGNTEWTQANSQADENETDNSSPLITRRRVSIGAGLLLGGAAITSAASSNLIGERNPNTGSQSVGSGSVDSGDEAISQTSTLTSSSAAETATSTTTETTTAPNSSPPNKAQLLPEDVESHDWFGNAVAVSDDGTTILVAAYEDDTAAAIDAGSVYVFKLSGGSWETKQKLTATDAAPSSYFGRSVTISADGTTAIIGAAHDNENGKSAGAAYIFERSESGWSQQAKLFPDGGAPYATFGGTCELSPDGSTAFIGAEESDYSNRDMSGVVYVFKYSGGSWRQQAKVAPNNGSRYDQFGSSIALSGDGTTAIIGAHNDDNQGVKKAGAAYVFVEEDGEWQEQVKLLPENPNTREFFGRATAISRDGDTVLVGAMWDNDPNGEKGGSVRVYDAGGGEWTRQTILGADDGDSRDRFGTDIGLSSSGTTAVISANRDEDPHGENAGSAYVFEQVDGTWSQQSKLIPEDSDEGDRYGSSVALSSDAKMTVLGAVGVNRQGTGAGAAYVFTL
jgi:hypothetical protein